jgi:glycosyltransferase involved in cell wall biosynthesis
MVKVSVIVPTYNRAHLVTETIDSILSQTFRDFELIIVDNESVDNTEEVIKSYRDERIRYFKHQNNGIIAVNRNYGISKARGEYIAFCDDDDLWFPEKLEKQVQVMESDSQIGLICTNEIVFDNKGDHGLTIRTRVRNSDFTFESLVWNNRVPNSTVMVRKAVLDDVGMMDESPEIMAGEDYELWLRIAKKYRLNYISLPLGKYRTHPGAYRKGPIKAQEQSKLIYKKLVDEGILDTDLFNKRISKLNQEILLIKFLTRTRTLRTALFIMQLIRGLQRFITGGK